MRAKDLSYYIEAFGKLRRDEKPKFGKAPHKPVLLLSLIQAFEHGLIMSNRIYISPELISFFKTNWSHLVTTGHTLNFALPFFHMRSEKFWRLVPKPGSEIAMTSSHSVRSMSSLVATTDYAEIDRELFELFTDGASRTALKFVLLDYYFNNHSLGRNDEALHYIENIRHQITHDPPEVYQAFLKGLQENTNRENFEEEVYVRAGLFKREIPRLYKNTCCISEMRVDAVGDISMVDACHIIPWSKSYDDTISNGFCLCPNLHRAFDRGLIAIDDEYRVIVAGNFMESENSPYRIKDFEGKRILLPDQVQYYPGLENFKRQRDLWHL